MELIYLIPALRVILGILFIVSGALKFPNLKGFAVIVASYKLLPRFLVKPVAYTQPFIEFAIGWWILSGKYLLWAAWAGLALIVVADIFVLKAFLQKKKMKNCGCYGTSLKVPLDWKKIVENGIWTLLFIVLVFAAWQAEIYGLL